MKKTSFSIIVSCLISISATAQNLQSIPMDTAIRYGKLSNGMTYYIRHNEQPKQRADFFIAQNVGAILEEKSQKGLAHFLEHMAFNGTKNFPGKSLINYFETIGVKFGQNINAYTSLDETVYNLSEVPTTREGIIDSALLVLHDWSSAISLDETEIDKERGVILEEWRRWQSADTRLWMASNKVTMAGSPYSECNIIGDTAVINRFSYQTLRNYYKKWYRPDLQAILIVGDINVSQIEAKIKAAFNDIPTPVNPAKRPYYPIPDNQEPIVGVFTDPEVETSQVDLLFRQNPISKEMKLSIQGYGFSIIKELINTMTNQRLAEIKQESESPFTDIGAAITELVRTKDVFAFYCSPATGKEQAARERLLKEAEIIKRFGFTTSELERAKQSMISNYEKSYKERNQQKNTSLVREYTRNFLMAEPIPGIEWEHQFITKYLPVMPLDVVNQFAKNYIGDKNIVYTMTGPEKKDLVYPTNEKLKQEITAVKGIELAAYKDNVSNEPLISEKLKPGKVKKTTLNQTLGTTEWLLSNGVKVVFKPTKFKDDEIRMSAWSFGGLSLLPIQDLPSAMYTSYVVGQSGLGNFNLSDLRKKLTGKIASVGTTISAYNEGMSGYSSVKDLETMLQLIYLSYAAPREDENTYKNLMKTMRTNLENASLNPENAYSDSISTILYGHHPRVILSNIENLEKVNYPSIQRIYKERFANPADFTFEFVGNMDEKTFKPLIELYLGSLKTTPNKEKWKDNGIRIQKGQQYQEIEKPLRTPKTTNYIHYSIDLPFNMENSVLMKTIDNLLDLRYTATIREEEGASYSIGVNGYLSNKPVEKGELVISFETDPKLYKKMLGIIHEEIQSLAENGPKAEDLNKVRLNLIKQLKEDQADNSWWMNTISSYYRDGLNYGTDYAKAVEKLDSESIKAIAKMILDQKNRTEIILIPNTK